MEHNMTKNNWQEDVWHKKTVLKVYPKQLSPFKFYWSEFGKLEYVRSSSKCPHGFYMGVGCPKGCSALLKKRENTCIIIK